MANSKSVAAGKQGGRYQDLKRMLSGRRQELLSQVHEKMRDVRTEGRAGKLSEFFDAGESSGSDVQEDIDFALIQMKGDTLSKIEEALARLEEGAYGFCFECGEEISKQRLKALPFAVRCKDCEEAHESSRNSERLSAQRSTQTSIYSGFSL